MALNKQTALYGMIGDQSGQALPWIALLMSLFLGVTALVADVGHGMVVSRQLQASTDAAALAGAQSLPNTTYSTAASNYSAAAGGLNARSGLTGVTATVTGACLKTVTNWGVPCVAPANYNAVVVKQSVTIPTWFAGVIGIHTMKLSTTSTAAMRGAQRAPYNVALILDTTRSMADADSVGNCTGTRITCALAGVQILLKNLSPCMSGLTACGSVTNGNVANAVDEVAVFTYPGLNSGDAKYEYNGGTISSSYISKYNDATTSTYSNLPEYEVLPLSSDYRSSDSSVSLNTTSNLSLLAGAKKGTGMQAVGGVGTYYAGAVQMAQSYLAAQSASRSNSQNVIVVLSDGDAQASYTNMPNASKTSGTYPSSKNECHQAITAANNAKTAGTQVFVVAYGSGTSGTCSTDSPAITACSTLSQMASSPATFFTDQSSRNSGCTSPSRPTTDLNTIFTQIAGYMSVARLIPNGTI
jgi:Flp pilus assembly protein TadG